MSSFFKRCLNIHRALISRGTTLVTKQFRQFSGFTDQKSNNLRLHLSQHTTRILQPIPSCQPPGPKGVSLKLIPQHFQIYCGVLTIGLRAGDTFCIFPCPDNPGAIFSSATSDMEKPATHQWIAEIFHQSQSKVSFLHK